MQNVEGKISIIVTGYFLQQAGTLSGNPLAMTAGIKTLEIMGRPGAYEQLSEMSKKVVEGILEAGKAAGHDVCGGYIGGTCLTFIIVVENRNEVELTC